MMVGHGIVLGRVIGIFMFATGCSLLLNKQNWMAVVQSVRGNPTALYITAVFELAAGLIVVTIHPGWPLDWRFLVTLLGWLLILEALVFLFYPLQSLIRIVEELNRRVYYNLCGTVLVIIGLYLTIMSLR